MNDFNDPVQILTYLNSINTSACDALAHNDIQAFHAVIQDLEDAGINQTQLGQNVIAYSNMFSASSPYNDLFTNYGFSKIKDNEFFLTNDAFRKTVRRINDANESCLMFMIEAKKFNNSEQALNDSYTYQGDADAEEIPIKKGMSINKEEEDALKAAQKSDRKIIGNLIKAQMKYLDDINKLLYHTEMEYSINETNKDSETIIKLDDKYTYEDKARAYVQPIIQLAKERRKYILTYQQDMEEVIPDFDNCDSLADVLDQVNEYLELPYIDETRPFYYFEPVSISDDFKSEKYTLQQYLSKTGNYAKNRLSFWTQGRHQTHEYMDWKRETALRTFLYLGIPSVDMDAFFRLYGICFGSSTDVFTTVLNDGTKMFLPEAYVRNLINLGLSYDIINYIIPIRNPD